MGRVEPDKDVDARARIVSEDIELLVDRKAPRQASGHGGVAVLDDDPLGARRRVVTELRTDQRDVARPVVKSVRRGVKADEPASMMHVRDERTLSGSAERELS
jgi:hypothetical protein